MSITHAFTKKNCMIIVGIVVALMIIGSFQDYAISLFLYNEANLFGQIFAGYGELPATAAMAVGGAILIKTMNKDKKAQMIFTILGCGLLNVLSILMLSMQGSMYIKGMPVFLSVIIALVLILGADFLVLHFSKDADRSTLRKVACILILVPFVEMIIINLIKIPWGRPRMRMIAVTPEAHFQPWWIIGSSMKETLMAIGVASEEFKSFPSGHTANASVAMLLSLLPLICKSLKNKENLLFYIGLAFALTVAFSRIIMGAHFVSDTTIGLFVAFIIEMLIVNWKFPKTIKIKNKK